ncbi:hypothetical protein SAMN04488689_105194 [Paenibacillus sp. cl6col]|nr:hypothetical protein SAMN04488689_105194 [Paenibacillus sp. cl6col]
MVCKQLVSFSTYMNEQPSGLHAGGLFVLFLRYYDFLYNVQQVQEYEQNDYRNDITQQHHI